MSTTTTHSAPRAILAPDPNPVKPKYVPPPNACDGHCHIFGPGAQFPYAANRSYTPEDAGKERLAALHKHLGLSRAILVQASCHGTDNRAMLDAMGWSKGAWRGVAMVKPDVSDKELDSLHAAGVRGARINFVAHLGGAPDMSAVDSVIARIAPFNWHIQLHMDAHDIKSYRGFLDNLKIPFIIDHMGRPEAKLGVKQDAFVQMLDLMKNPLAWSKVSGPERISSTGKPFHDAEPFVRELIAAAPERILWGTDFPHPNVKIMPNDGELMDLFAKFCDDDALRKKILVDNPNTLYWPEAIAQ